jgi:hypothetical protein
MPHRPQCAEHPSRPVPALTGLGTLKRNHNPADRHEQILTTRVGLRFPDNLTYSSWERAGIQISRVVDAFAWCLGDWLVYGKRQFPDRYRIAVDAVGLDYQTLRNYASVARRVTMPRRRPTLSFQHHAEVAALTEPDQVHWLARAEESGWSRNQLRQRLNDNRRGVPVPANTVIPAIRVGSDQAERWRAAANRSSHVFEKWVVMVLDHAAAQALAR